jgi:hypothetical protein
VLLVRVGTGAHQPSPASGSPAGGAKTALTLYRTASVAEPTRAAVACAAKPLEAQASRAARLGGLLSAAVARFA